MLAHVVQAGSDPWAEPLATEEVATEAELQRLLARFQILELYADELHDDLLELPAAVYFVPLKKKE